MKHRNRVRSTRLALQEAAAEIEAIANRVKHLRGELISSGAEFELDEGANLIGRASERWRQAGADEVACFNDLHSIECFACGEGLLGFDGCDSCGARRVA